MAHSRVIIMIIIFKIIIINYYYYYYYYMHIHRHSGPHRHNFANAGGLQKLEVRIHGPPTY